jgi:predicted nucleic acid-binding Zn ribbon protein
MSNEQSKYFRGTVFNAIFINISAMSWQSFLLWEEIEVSAENHRPVAIHRKTLSINAPSHAPRHQQDSKLR